MEAKLVITGVSKQAQGKKGGTRTHLRPTHPLGPKLNGLKHLDISAWSPSSHLRDNTSMVSEWESLRPSSVTRLAFPVYTLPHLHPIRLDPDE